MFGFYKLAVATVLLAMLWCVVLVQHPDSPAFVRPTSATPGPVRILRFYASAGVLITGEKAKLCYGVENAKSVSIAPLMAKVIPSSGRCLEIIPQHTTHYVILAEGYDGKVAMQSLTLAVQKPTEPPQPKWSYAGI